MPTFVADENDQVASAKARRQVVLKLKSRSDPDMQRRMPYLLPYLSLEPQSQPQPPMSSPPNPIGHPLL